MLLLEKQLSLLENIVDSVEFGESKANSGASDTSSYGHSESKSTNNVMETPVFDDNSSDDMGTPAEIDDEFPF